MKKFAWELLYAVLERASNTIDRAADWAFKRVWRYRNANHRQ